MGSDEKNVTRDAFGLRGGERVVLCRDGIAVEDRYAVMAAPVPGLPDPMHTVSESGEPVEAAAIIAAEKVNGRWQWMHLAPDAKRIIGDTLFDHGLFDGLWHGMRVMTAKEEATDGQ